MYVLLGILLYVYLSLIFKKYIIDFNYFFQHFKEFDIIKTYFL
jgi:hypothetical protein